MIEPENLYDSETIQCSIRHVRIVGNIVNSPLVGGKEKHLIEFTDESQVICDKGKMKNNFSRIL